ncbi:MAG: multiheme c-type cytochrome [Myxococcota bacterium]
MRGARLGRRGGAAVIGWLLAGCSPDRLSDEELRDPAACEGCHPAQFEQWSGSMHAYAAEDPVFLAMNARGQRETNGELGDFCVKCHAPAAVLLGETADGTDLDSVEPALKGVTCWWCHQVTDVQGDHDNPLVIAQDRVMRGPFSDPTETRAHDSEGSPHHARDDARSAALCGSCHDIVNPLGTHVEATFAEWGGSVFAKPGFGLTCSACHMTGSDGVAAEVEGVPLRRVADHSMPGIDVALTSFPGRDRQRALVQELLDDSVAAYLCVGPAGDPTLAVATLENVAAGHRFPSGATSDRRVWVEVTAYQGDTVLFHTGAPDPRIAEVDDPDLWRIWSTLTGTSGEPVHMFWEAAAIDSAGLLPVQATLDVADPAWVQTHVSTNYLVRGGTPDRITMAVHAQPFGAEILDELVATGDLDPAVIAEVPTFTLAPTVLEWTPAVPINSGSLACVPQPPPVVTPAQ